MKKRKKVVSPFNVTFKMKLAIRFHSIVCHPENGRRCTATDKGAYARLQSHYGGPRNRITSRFVNRYTLHRWL